MSQLEYNCVEVINSVTCIKVAYLGCYLIPRREKGGLPRKSRGCLWGVFVSCTVPFCHRWVEEKGGNLQSEYRLSLFLTINFIGLLCKLIKLYIVVPLHKHKYHLVNIYISYVIFHSLYQPLWSLDYLLVYAVVHGFPS